MKFASQRFDARLSFEILLALTKTILNSDPEMLGMP